MAEMDCSSSEQYVAKAIELATNRSVLSAVKNKLAIARQTGIFLDVRSFVRSLEDALQIAWERHVAGLAPADIKIAG